MKVSTHTRPFAFFRVRDQPATLGKCLLVPTQIRRQCHLPGAANFNGGPEQAYTAATEKPIGNGSETQNARRVGRALQSVT